MTKCILGSWVQQYSPSPDPGITLCMNSLEREDRTRNQVQMLDVPPQMTERVHKTRETKLDEIFIF